MNSSKDLLKLENEYRNDIKIPKAKPNITPMKKPTLLTEKISKFLDETKKPESLKGPNEQTSDTKHNHHVEMDLMIVQEDV